MTSLWIARHQLSSSPDVNAVRDLIDPARRHRGGEDAREQGRRTDAHHRLIWSLFADGPDRCRDFLWRSEGQGRFITLSAREPLRSGLFEPAEVKPFVPALRAGDRLGFVLRVNATRARKLGGSGRGKRVDVVMDALYETDPLQRAGLRPDLAQSVAETWVDGQGGRAGFKTDQCQVDGYTVHVLPGSPGKREGSPKYGILDLRGQITVVDPAAFLIRLASGFGHARAFGCGLMLIRRL